MTEGEKFQEQIKPEIEFEETPEGHRIIFNPENRNYIPAALAIAAFSRAKVAKGGFMTGHRGYKSKITPKIAKEVMKDSADNKSGQIFFMDYFHGKEVKLGARANKDGSITLFDREGKPISKEEAQKIAEDANYCLQEVIDAEAEE